MWTIKLRLGIAEIVALASLGVVAAVITVAIIEWPVAVVPAGTYALGMSVAYGMYRRYSNESSHAAAHARQAEAHGVIFRVVETHGVCPLGRRIGDYVTVRNGGTAPDICPEAAGVLRLAARDGQVKQWCCPIYEHMLVFERERVAV
jgi:hypothetical protein